MSTPLRLPFALGLSGLVTLLAVGCGGTSETEEGPKLVLGLVPATEAQRMVDNLEPLVAFLSAELGMPVEGFVPQDYTGLVEAMGAGRADVGMLPPFASMLAEERYGIETVLISLRQGSATYLSQWMTKDESMCDTPIEDRGGLRFCHGAIDHVRGKQVGFTDPTSTSGHLFPALQLLDAGIHPERDITPVFVGSHDAAVVAVYNGDTAVGVSFDDARTWVQEQYPDVGQAVIVFNESAPIPNDGVTVRGDLDPALKLRIRDAFKKVTESEAHLPLEEQTLYQIYEIDGFIDFEPGLHEPVRRAFRELRDRIDLGG